MTDPRRISIAIPSYNRSRMTIESFIDVYDDKRINEIVIVDDASDLEVYAELQNLVRGFDGGKIKLFRNKTNRDCYVNKATALSYTNNPFSILLDSDNRLATDYLDRIYSYEWVKEVILTPDFAFPHFDFRKYSNLLITKENVSQYIGLPMFETMLNAANFFVNKDEYVRIWDEYTDPVTSDSIYMMSRWLGDGNKIQVVSGLQYFHRVHGGSHYQNEKHRTPDGFHESVLKKIREMV
jgi:glycosyltransferase involved in cell wall biosynthesis